jgi:hypothetical protein
LIGARPILDVGARGFAIGEAERGLGIEDTEQVAQRRGEQTGGVGAERPWDWVSHDAVDGVGRDPRDGDRGIAREPADYECAGARPIEDMEEERAAFVRGFAKSLRRERGAGCAVDTVAVLGHPSADAAEDQLVLGPISPLPMGPMLSSTLPPRAATLASRRMNYSGGLWLWSNL